MTPRDRSPRDDRVTVSRRGSGVRVCVRCVAYGAIIRRDAERPTFAITFLVRSTRASSYTRHEKRGETVPHDLSPPAPAQARIGLREASTRTSIVGLPPTPPASAAA